MKKLRLNPYDLKISSLFQSRKKEQILNKYKDRSFYERTKKISIWLFLLALSCSIFSGYSESYYLQNFLNDSINNQTVSFAAMVVIVAAIELVKRSIIPSFFAYYFKHGKIDKLIAVFIIVFCGISILCSFLGAKILPQKTAAPPALLSIDKIRADYDKQLSTVDKSISRQESTTWKGKITNQANKNIKSLSNQKTALIQLRDNAINKAEEENKNRENDHNNNLAAKGSNIGYATLISEALLLLLIGFLEYRDFTVYALHQEQEPEEPTAAVEFKQNPIQFSNNTPAAATAKTTTQRIGFKHYPTEEPTAAVEKTRPTDAVITESVIKQNQSIRTGDADNANETEEPTAAVEFIKKAKVGSKINCPNCSKQHIKTTYNKTFCSTDCRIEFWEKKKGTTFIKGKKR